MDEKQEYPALEVKCEPCNSSGLFAGLICDKCDGKGWVPTEFGQAILSLVFAHFKVEKD